MAESIETKHLVAKMSNIANYNKYEIEELKVEIKSLVDLKTATAYNLRLKEQELSAFEKSNEINLLELTYKNLQRNVFEINQNLLVAKANNDLEQANVFEQQLIPLRASAEQAKLVLVNFEQLKRERNLLQEQTELLKQQILSLKGSINEEQPLDLTQNKQGVSEYLSDFKKLYGERGYMQLMHFIEQRRQAGEPFYSNDFEYVANEIKLHQSESEITLNPSQTKLAGGHPVEEPVQEPTQPQITEAEADEKVSEILTDEAIKQVEVNQEKAKPKLMKKITDKVKGLTFLEKLKIILGSLFVLAYPIGFIAPILVGAEIMGPELSKKK